MVGDEPLRDNGKYLMILERLPGGPWKAGRGIWNSDTPPPRME